MEVQARETYYHDFQAKAKSSYFWCLAACLVVTGNLERWAPIFEMPTGSDDTECLATFMEVH
jgi:hypothetical protein